MKRILIIGRPNVGKSSLFNSLLGYRRTIVLDEPGTTLDEVCERVKLGNVDFLLADTQGIFEESDLALLKPILKRADAFLFVVDSKSGVTPFDRLIGEQVRQMKKPTLVLVNKIDAPRGSDVLEFSQLGFDNLLGISVSHRKAISEVKRWMVEQAGGEASAEVLQEKLETPTNIMKLAIVGRPNTGKSTLMNHLCGTTVSRVSPQALTTRDAVSHEITTNQGLIKVLDTAGMRRPRSQKMTLETFAVHASTRAIKDADVVFLCIASHEPMTDQDMRLLSLLEREGRPCVVLLNFWDKLTAKEKKDYVDNSDFGRYLEQFKVVPISGKTGFGTDRLLPLAWRLHRAAGHRVQTSKLNKIIETIISRNPPPTMGLKNFNILYASQVKTDPPTFVFFMNRKGSLPDSYRKYLENQLRDRLGLRSQPIRVYFRGDDGKKRERYGSAGKSF